MTELLGKQVRVTLGTDVIAQGQLLSYGDDGAFVLQDEMGFIHHCWPLLDIVSLEDD